MKVLVICGSHRSKQVTYGLAEQFAQKIKGKREVEVEICELANMKIEGCCGTAACTKTPEKRCVHNNDDFNKIFNKMAESDAILFIVPKYAPYPSRISAMFERLTSISWWGFGEHGKINDFILAGKPAAIATFCSTPGIPPEVFYPLIFNYSELGFKVAKFDTINVLGPNRDNLNQLPGLFFNRADNKDEEYMEKVAQALHEIMV